MADRWATFDCYGTLIDWERGIQGAFLSLWPEADAERLLARYHEIEPEVQEGRDVPYRQVLAAVLRRLAEDERLPLRPGDEGALGASLPSWPAFPEVPGALGRSRERGWRLAILSNTDPDLLAMSLQHIDVPFDLTITAADAGSYKPAHGHWERFFELSGADRDAHVHVGASLFHDVVPASEMGLRIVWINRLGQATNVPRDAELLDLTELPDTLDGLVPA
jgi:2-haloacid dehalogenase